MSRNVHVPHLYVRTRPSLLFGYKLSIRIQALPFYKCAWPQFVWELNQLCMSPLLLQHLHKHKAKVLCLTMGGDHSLEFEGVTVSNQVSHPSTYHNICGLECDYPRNTKYPGTASHDFGIFGPLSECKVDI